MRKISHDRKKCTIAKPPLRQSFDAASVERTLARMFEVAQPKCIIQMEQNIFKPLSKIKTRINV